MAPAGPGRPRPPVSVVFQVHRAGCLVKQHRAMHQILERRAWKILGIEWALGDSHVSRGRDELRELRIGYRAAIHPKSLNAYLADRALFGIEVLGAHPECAAWNPEHAGM